MSVVLAIEPDRAQAGVLRDVLLGIAGVEFVVVSSKDEAVEAIERAVPDLVLVNALLSPREEDELVAHLRTIENGSHLQLLTIPRLGRVDAARAAPRKSSLFGFGRKKPASALPKACDPAVFAEQVAQYLARAREVRTRPRPRVQPIRAARPAPPPASDQVPIYEPPSAVPAYEPPAPVYEPPAPAHESSVPLYEPPRDLPLYEPSRDAVSAGPDLESIQGLGALTDPLPPAEDPATGDVDALIERLGFTVSLDQPVEPGATETATTALPPAPIAEDGPLIDPAPILEAARAVEPPIAPAAPLIDPDPTVDAEPEIDLTGILDIAQVRAEAEATLAAEIERVQVEAAQRRERELAEWQAEAEALREATVGRARVEAEANARAALAAELERSRADAERARQDEIARLQAQADERLEAVTRQARQVAEAEAASAFTEELARQRADAEAAASRALESEVSRVRGEADTRLQAELDRVRREAEEARRAEQSAAHAQAERIRETAAHEARAIAEAAATRTLEAEIQRVRAEAEAVRAAAEKRLAEQSKVQAEVSQVVADAERLREAAAREARAIAEATAARTLEAELQRLRAEADARLAQQTEAELTAEKMREAAAREARLVAEAAASRTLEAEIQRVRADADARLSAELAQLRDEAERSRAIELDEMRRQVDEMREAAAEQARSAAAEAVAAEVARASALRSSTPPPRPISVVRAPAPRAAAPDPEPPVEPVEQAGDDAPEPSGSYYDLWRAEGSPALSPPEARPWARSVPSRFRRKKWMLPAAASLLLVVCGSVSVDTTGWAATARKAIASAMPAPGTKPDEATPARPDAPPTGSLLVETTPKGAQVTVDGTLRGKTPLTVTNLSPGRHKIMLDSSDGVIITREVTIRAGERAVTSELMVSGWLTVFSRVPVDVHVGGRRVGSSGDGQLILSPGRHTVTFVNRALNIRETRTIEIQAGSIASYTVKLPSGTLHVDAPAGADVFVDGERIGKAPLRGAPVAVGTRDIAVLHPALGERRQTIDVTAGAPVTVTITPDPDQPGRSFDGLKVLSESAANPGIRKPARPPR
ncbi:MAG: PEGA domain-containing protein [Vicinamibacterales bacterium]